MNPDGTVVIEAKMDTKTFDAQIKSLELELDTVEKKMSNPKKYGLSKDNIADLTVRAEKLKNKLIELNEKKDKLNQPPNLLGDFFGNFSNTLKNSIKKVEQLILGIFGIRGAYMAVRNAVSIISNDDQQMKADIDYIRNVLAYSLEPVVRTIVSWVKTLVGYFGYLTKAWFGYDIFAKATAKSLQSGAGSAKEIRKQLAGFDEMNVLQDSSSGGGGAGGGALPDLEGIQNVKIPKWLEWIANNKDIVLGFLATVATIIGSIKLAKLLTALTKMFPILKGITKLQLLGLLVGIVTAIDGIIRTVSALIKYIGDPSWSNFNKILDGLSETVIGIGIAFVALNASNPVGWVIIATGIMIEYARVMSDMFRVLVDGKAEILSTKEAQDRLNQAINEAVSADERYTSAIEKQEEAQRKLKELEEQARISGEELYNSVQDGTRIYSELSPELREVYKAYRDNLKAEEEVKQASENLTDAKKKEKDMSWEMQLSLANESGKYDEFRDAVVKAYKDGSLSADDARDLIERAMSKIDSKTDETFTQNIPDQVKKGLDPNRYRADVWNFVDVINGILGHISLPNLGGVIGGWIGSGKMFGFAKGGIVVPKLASGGIINQPGSGVPITSAIGGERGMEGVIPLTDSQQMELLGESIGKYITINANIVNTMNGKVLSRELQRVQNNTDFASNN